MPFGSEGAAELFGPEGRVLTYKVLVVEDEPLIRLGMLALLEQAGYQTFEAANADQAIEVMEREAGIRVVVTDVDMPGSMDGVRLAHAVRTRWPPTVLIVISGKVGLSEVDLPTGTRFFSKPFQEAFLLRTIEELVA